MKNVKKISEHGPELNNDEKFMRTHEDILTPIIMYSKSEKAEEFRSKLVFKQHDVIMT